MFQAPVTIVLEGLYQTLWRPDQNTKERDSYDSLYTMPSDATPAPSTPTVQHSTLIQLSPIAAAFTLPLSVLGGLGPVDACFLTIMLVSLAFVVTMVCESTPEVEKTGERAKVEKKATCGKEEYVKALEQKLETWGKMWEDKVMDKVTKGADLAPTSTTCSKVTPAASKRLLFWWSPVPHTLYITVFIALPSMVAQCVAGWTTEQNMLFTAMLMGVSCFLEIFWMFVLEPSGEDTGTKREVTAEVREKTTAATGSGQHIETLEKKIDKLNKRLEHQGMAASRPAPASTIPRNTSRARPQTGLLSTFSRLSTIDWLMSILTPLMITGNLYCYTEGLISFCSMVYLITLSLVTFFIAVSISILSQKSKQEKAGITDAKKREPEQKAVVECVKALENKIDGMGKIMKSEMEGIEKRLVERAEEMEQRLYRCTETEVDHLKAGLEETLTKQMSAKNDVMRRRLEKKVSVVVRGMEGKMQQWSQDKIGELNERISASLEAKFPSQEEECSKKTSEMPKQLTVLTEQLELALESEWKGIGKAKAMERLGEAMGNVMLLAEPRLAKVLSIDSITDFEEGLEMAVGRMKLGIDAHDAPDEVFVRSHEESRETDIDIEEDSDDDWKLIDQI